MIKTFTPDELLLKFLYNELEEKKIFEEELTQNDQLLDEFIQLENTLFRLNQLTPEPSTSVVNRILDYAYKQAV